mgnify:CR=1 FL=1
MLNQRDTSQPLSQSAWPFDTSQPLSQSAWPSNTSQPFSIENHVDVTLPSLPRTHMHKVHASVLNTRRGIIDKAKSCELLCIDILLGFYSESKFLRQGVDICTMFSIHFRQETGDRTF